MECVITHASPEFCPIYSTLYEAIIILNVLQAGIITTHFKL